MNNIILTWIEQNNGEEIEYEEQFPSKMEVCNKCHGYGTHLTPSIGEHAYSAEEFEESFPDEESREHYFGRGGMYDVTCHKCNGLRVVSVVDEESFSEKEKNFYERYRKYAESQAQYEREEDAMYRLERMMGC